MRMAVYAAQIDRMDQGIGRIMAQVKNLGIEDNTLILFLSDNGGNYEETPNSWEGALFIPQETPDARRVQVGNAPPVIPGPADTYQSYGIPWANTSNTPFRRYKHYAHTIGALSSALASERRWSQASKEDACARDQNARRKHVPPLVVGSARATRLSG